LDVDQLKSILETLPSSRELRELQAGALLDAALLKPLIALAEQLERRRQPAIQASAGTKRRRRL
jgi:hypothetical protein